MYIYLDSILNRSQIGVKSELSRSYVCSSCVKKKEKMCIQTIFYECTFQLYEFMLQIKVMTISSSPLLSCGRFQSELL